MMVGEHDTVIQDPIHSLKEDLATCGIKPNRLKGQNYLISTRIRNRIAECANLLSREAVLEIGSGTGVLTWALVALSNDVLVVEKEPTAAQLLEHRFAGCSNLKVLNADGLKVMKELTHNSNSEPRKVVSNLPFAISSPVLMTMAANPNVFPGGVLLLQKEVVDRVVATPGDPERSALSVLVQTRFQSRRAFNVKATHFRPVPSVDSAVLILEPIKMEILVPWSYFTKTVFEMFTHRRKTLFNNLRTVTNEEVAEKILKETKIKGETRAQQVSVESFIQLAQTKLLMEKAA